MYRSQAGPRFQVLIILLGFFAGAPLLSVGAIGAENTDDPPIMPVQLLFDGQPLHPTAKPDFSCRDNTTDNWFDCRITADPAGNGYVMPRPTPGTYTLHIEIDENASNPARFPGD